MKVTRRQLRRIIREAIDPREMEEPRGGYVGNALRNDPDYGMEFEAEIQESVIGVLSGMIMGGKDLAAAVGDELAEFNITENEVFAVLDKMLEDGAVVFDVEEDEWSLP
jgi:hypothetical protein